MSKEKRAESPTPSCVSLKSDRSIESPPYLSNGPKPSNTKGQTVYRQRAESPTPSCVSLKSDWSMEPPPTPSCVSLKSDWSMEPPPIPSCVSLKSDRSIEHPPYLSNGPRPSDTKGQTVYRQRAESPTLSCVSLKSDRSIEHPPYLSNEPKPSDTKGQTVYRQRAASPTCGPVSVISKRSIEHPLYFRPGLQTERRQMNVGLQEDFNEHVISLKLSNEHVTEGTNKPESKTPLNTVFTELHVIEGLSEEANNQHEVEQLENASMMQTPYKATIKSCEILKLLDEQQKNRVVMTYGIAGTGKTFTVQKFTLDWAEGLKNQEVNVVIPLSFRELNLIKEPYSLLRLIHVFHPTLKKLTVEQLAGLKVLFIFDGLDESRLPLEFEKNEVVFDVTQETSVNVLLTNLIKGKLLPSALVWITSRPAAANQIPHACFDRVTEVRGFTDAQKEEYFRKRFRDEDLCNRIISHIKRSRSLHIMCHLPVFCWITATVLEHMFTTDQTGEPPMTLTGMYSHFLLVQTKRKKHKYGEEQEAGPQELTEADRDVLLKLGRLAFEQLEKGHIMFYEKDLERCGLDVKEASVYSGVCTQIFKRESVIFQKMVYSFVHLSFQEFLAAVYMHHCYITKNNPVLEAFLGKKQLNSTLNTFLMGAMKKSLKSKNGHLNLFVRFLHGLSLPSNQRLLGGLLGPTESNSPEIIQTVIKKLKKMNNENISSDRSINIFHCLTEMNDLSVCQEIQEVLKSEKTTKKDLSDIHCSALTYTLQGLEMVLEELNLNEYKTSYQGRRRLIPAVRNCKKAVWK